MHCVTLWWNEHGCPRSAVAFLRLHPPHRAILDLTGGAVPAPEQGAALLCRIPGVPWRRKTVSNGQVEDAHVCEWEATEHRPQAAGAAAVSSPWERPLWRQLRDVSHGHAGAESNSAAACNIIFASTAVAETHLKLCKGARGTHSPRHVHSWPLLFYTHTRILCTPIKAQHGRQRQVDQPKSSMQPRQGCCLLATPTARGSTLCCRNSPSHSQRSRGASSPRVAAPR